MPKLRLPARTRRGGPLLALGVAAALVALPGVAHADAPSLPTVTPGQLSTAFPGASAACSTTMASDMTQLFTDLATPPTALPGSLSEVITALQAALGPDATADQFIQALQALGLSSPPVSTGSGTNPAGGLSNVAGDLTGSTDATNGGGPGTVATDQTQTTPLASGDPSKVPADLQLLGADFFRFCVPSPPSGLPSPPSLPSSSGGQQQTGTQTASQPDTQPQTQPETQPVTQPATQPVSYPSYAATGGIASRALRPASDQRPSETVPLSVLGGVVLVSAAAAVGVRSRARRSGR